MTNDIAAKIIFIFVVILGCILVRFGLDGNAVLLFIGLALVAGGIMAQVALVIIPVIIAIRDKCKDKKEEEEEDSVGLGIK